MLTYVRVTDLDTGHHLTVPDFEVANGNYRVLKQAAVDHNGDPLPAELHAAKPLSSTAKGQQADDTTKEN